jgi:uncharacterized membrane protein YheB (UPF0754 family)
MRFLDTDTKVEDAIFWTNFGLKIGEKEQSNQKKQKEGKRRKNHSNFIRHIFTHNRHTHTHKEDRTIKKRLKDFVSVKRRRSLRRSAFIYILFAKRDYYTLCHKKHIKIIISTFLKIQGRER